VSDRYNPKYIKLVRQTTVAQLIFDTVLPPVIFLILQFVVLHKS